ncbi:MAG: polymer-forming cytoskeletal protein [Candidatus Saccharibacteria bacterium]|nr:polymer-forming cytoskeletal protein [Candidatus Saccharibacteria bacterium]
MRSKLKTFLLVAGFSLFLLAGYSTATSAHSVKSGDIVTVAQSETINETVFLAGQNLQINGTINGDVFCAAETISVNGTVNGDVMCAGMTMTLNGHVNGDMRVAVQTIVQNGEVTGSVTSGSQSYNLNNDGRIGRDLTGAASNVSISGEVGRDVGLGAETANITGTIGRNVQGEIQQLTLSDGSDIAGDITYTSVNELYRPANATVGGEVTRSTPEESPDQRFFGLSLGVVVYGLAAMLITSLVLVLLFPRIFQNVTDTVHGSVAKTLLVGFIASVVVPVGLVLLLFTIAGIPLAMIFGFSWLVAVLLSGPFTAYYVGRRVLSGENRVVLIMLAGSLLALVLYITPIVSPFALLLSYWLGLGMLLRGLVRYAPKPTYVVSETPSKKSAKKSTKK